MAGDIAQEGKAMLSVSLGSVQSTHRQTEVAEVTDLFLLLQQTVCAWRVCVFKGKRENIFKWVFKKNPIHSQYQLYC